MTPIKTKTYILVLTGLLCFGIWGCKTVSEFWNDPNFLKQKIIFDVEYENHAWGDAHYGQYIDNEGNIYEYNLIGQNWGHPSDQYHFTEQELLKKFNDKQKIGSIDVETLYQKYKQIESLSNSDLTEWQDTGCRDLGVFVSSAYKFDPQNSIYERIILLGCGDGFRMNSSAIAQSITQWLSQRIEMMPAYGETCCAPTD